MASFTGQLHAYLNSLPTGYLHALLSVSKLFVKVICYLQATLVGK